MPTFKDFIEIEAGKDSKDNHKNQIKNDGGSVIYITDVKTLASAGS